MVPLHPWLIGRVTKNISGCKSGVKFKMAGYGRDENTCHAMRVILPAQAGQQAKQSFVGEGIKKNKIKVVLKIVNYFQHLFLSPFLL